MLSAGARPLVGCKGEFALARAELDLDRSQGQAERQHVAADDFQRRLHLVVALLGQILIAVREQADGGRASGLAGVFRRHVRVFELEEVEFDLQPRDEIVAALSELIENRAIEMPRRERHRAAVVEVEVAQQPARRRRPWQHAKGRRIRHHQNVGGAFHLLHAEAAARREHRKHRLVRGVLGQHRGGDGAAAFERRQRFAGHQRLAAQDAVLVGERQPDDFEIFLFDDSAQAAGGFLLLFRPETVTFDETQRVILPSCRHSGVMRSIETRNLEHSSRCAIAHLRSGPSHRPGMTVLEITPPPTDAGSCRRSRSAPARPTARRGGVSRRLPSSRFPSRASARCRPWWRGPGCCAHARRPGT